MSFHLRYGEPDWNETPCQGWHDQDIRQHPLSDRSYEELRYEATQKQWTTKFVALNTMALSSSTPNATFVNLKNLTDTVEVIVGEGDDQARWILHSSLLTNDSEFAAMALSRDFKEKSERIIRFPEEDPGVFGQYVTFLYAKMVFVFALETLVQMYTLGDRLQSIKFANACYESIAKTTDPYSASQIKYIFDNTYTDDRLRKLCISQVGKGILDGRYSFSIPHEQEILKDFMPELMVGVTAEVQKRRSGGEKWYPRPQASETGPGFPSGRPSASPAYSSTTTARPFFGPAPARPPIGGLFSTGAGSGNGATGFGFGTSSGPGLFGGPATSGGGLFGTGRSQPSSSSTSGGLFGAQGSNGGFSGGLFGNSSNNSGAAISNNPSLATSSSTTVAGTPGGLFNNHQHPPLSASSLSGGSRGGSLFSAQQHSPHPTSSLFGNTSRVQQQPSSGSLFAGPTQSHQGFGYGGNNTVDVQSIRPQGTVDGSTLSGADAVPSDSTANTASQAPGDSFSNTQSSSIAPSLFNNTSTASPYAAAPAPNGPPVFSFLVDAPTKTQQEQQNPTPSFSSASFVPAASQSAPTMWTVRNDSPQAHGVSSSSSQQNVIVANIDGNNGGHDNSTGDASSLAALEKASAINNPTRGFVPYTTSNFAPSNGLKFGTTPFHQITNGKAFAEGPSPSCQRVNGWRPAEDGTPSRSVSSQGATDGHENGNEEGKGKGKEPALDDAALSRDFTSMAFPENQDLLPRDDDYLKNAQGGKVTSDDKISPAFVEYLKVARLEKAEENTHSGHKESDGELENEKLEAQAHKGSASIDHAKENVVHESKTSNPADGDEIDYDAIKAELAAAEAEEARREKERAKQKAAKKEAQRRKEEEELAAYKANMMKEADRQAGELAMREKERKR